LEITATLARLVSQSRWEDLPEKVRHEARRTLLNFLGAALGGCRDVAVEHLVAVLGGFSGERNAALIGRPERLDALSAAFVNGAAANVLDFDDTHLPTVIHPAAPVAPAVLSLSEIRPVSGKEALHALILGLEVECRVGNAVTPWHYAHGWHITSTCGVIGAAAAAARLLRLDPVQTANAIGLAANQACGLIEGLGSMAKSVSVGAAPRNGLFSAFLAQRGYQAAPAMLEGPRGFAMVLGQDADLSKVTRRLGSDWEAARNTYKPYPCGIVLHPAIDAFLDLKKDGVAAERIESIVVTGHPLLRQRTDRPHPRSGREAQVSLQHTAGACFVYGAAGLEQYSDASTRDAAICSVGDKVRIIDDASMAVEAAVVSLRLETGERLERRVAQALGSLARPMSDAQIEAKTRDLARAGAPGVDAGRLIEALWRLDQSPEARQIFHIAVP
jgi:2-methylcitrate dehydratase PrpD